MGWSGRYYGYAPKGKARIQAVIEDEGYNWEDEKRKCEVIDSALCGSVVYLATRLTDKETGESSIQASVCLTHMRDGYLMIKSMGETSGPYAYDCPKRILDLLSEPANDWAREWREACEKRRKNKGDLAKLPLGTQIKLKKYSQPGDWIITVDKYRGRRAYIDWAHYTRFTPAAIRSWGYEIMKEENK